MSLKRASEYYHKTMINRCALRNTSACLEFIIRHLEILLVSNGTKLTYYITSVNQKQLEIPQKQ